MVPKILLKTASAYCETGIELKNVMKALMCGINVFGARTIYFKYHLIKKILFHKLYA